MDFLFAHRARRVAKHYNNEAIIRSPALLRALAARAGLVASTAILLGVVLVVVVCYPFAGGRLLLDFISGLLSRVAHRVTEARRHHHNTN